MSDLINFRAPTGLRARLAEAAEARGSTVTALIVRAIERELGEEGDAPVPRPRPAPAPKAAAARPDPKRVLAEATAGAAHLAVPKGLSPERAARLQEHREVMAERVPFGPPKLAPGSLARRKPVPGEPRRR